MAYKNKKKQKAHVRALHKPTKRRNKRAKTTRDEDAFLDKLKKQIGLD